MTGAELAAARARLGLTPDAMAAELRVPPHAYAACEAGRATLTRGPRERLVWRLSVVARQAALAASGLPECAWVAAWDARTQVGGRALDAHVRALEAHAPA
ncbi:hypothetical protein PYV61_23105, partial [Roseisolibacter sp. H3M3-2]